jgi:hypothetical protein
MRAGGTHHGLGRPRRRAWFSLRLDSGGTIKLLCAREDLPTRTAAPAKWWVPSSSKSLWGADDGILLGPDRFLTRFDAPEELRRPPRER